MSAILSSVNSSYLSRATSFGLNANGPFTFACWMKTTTAQGALMYLGNNTGTNYQVLQFSTTRTPRWRTRGSVAANSGVSGTIASNTWGHAAGYVNGSNLRQTYTNAVNGSAGTTNITGVNTFTDFYIGREDDLAPVYMTGEIAWAMLWNGVSLLLSDMANTSYDPWQFVGNPNLIGFWPLENDALDYSGNGHHLTAHNVTWGYQPYNFPRCYAIATDTENVSATVQLTPSLTVALADTESASATLALLLNAAIGANDTETCTATGTVGVSCDSSAVDRDDASATVEAAVDAVMTATDADAASATVELSVLLAGSADDQDQANVSCDVIVAPSVAAADEETASVMLELDVSGAAAAVDADNASVTVELTATTYADASDSEVASAVVAADVEVIASGVDSETAAALVELAVGLTITAVDDESAAASVTLAVETYAEAIDVDSAEASVGLSIEAGATAIDRDDASATVELVIYTDALADDYENASAIIEEEGVAYIEADAVDTETASAIVGVVVYVTASATDTENASAYIYTAGEVRLSKIVLRGIVADYIESVKNANDFFVFNDFEVTQTYVPRGQRKEFPPGGRVSVVCLASDDVITTQAYTKTIELPIQISYQRPVTGYGSESETELLDQLVTFEEQLRDVTAQSVLSNKVFGWQRTIALKDENQTPFDFVGLRSHLMFESYFTAYFTYVRRGPRGS